ncbi:hypothetical protein B0H63DRAFT_471365 [Podospora didyma]|uniref:Uncharacterized protein n=1 Tax=Podospora didyma TaxID=330526 RepID=A0AAE0NUM3_9PEZI|nr:hypothetical protein B0H63DRAFT_471365 [Podospora didyma]
MAFKQTHPSPPANKRVVEVKGSAGGDTRQQHRRRVNVKQVKRPSVLDPIRKQVNTTIQASYDTAGLAKLGKLVDAPITIKLGARLDLQNGSGNFFKPYVGSNLQDALAQLEKEDPFWTAPTDHATSELLSKDCNAISCTYTISEYFAARRENLEDVKALRLHSWFSHRPGRDGSFLAKRPKNDPSGWFNIQAYNYKKDTPEWIATVIDNQNLDVNKVLASELTTALYFMHRSLTVYKTAAPIPACYPAPASFFFHSWLTYPLCAFLQVLFFTYSHVAATTWIRISEFVFDNTAKTMTIRQSSASKIPQNWDDPTVHNIICWMFPTRVAPAAAVPGVSVGGSGALQPQGGRNNVTTSGRATPTAQGSHGQSSSSSGQTSSPLPRTAATTAAPPPQQQQQASASPSHHPIISIPPSRTSGTTAGSPSTNNSRPPPPQAAPPHTGGSGIRAHHHALQAPSNTRPPPQSSTSTTRSSPASPPTTANNNRSPPSSSDTTTTTTRPPSQAASSQGGAANKRLGPGEP